MQTSWHYSLAPIAKWPEIFLSSTGLARLGYAKLSGEGLDYDLSLVTMDGESHVNAVMRGAIDNSDWGWSFGVSSNGDEAAVSAGVSLTF